MTNHQLKKLYIKYNREVYLYAFSLCGNYDQAQDLIELVENESIKTIEVNQVLASKRYIY